MQNPGAYNRAFRINARVSSCHTLRPSALSNELATLLDVCKSVSSSSVANVAFRPVPCIFLLHKWLRFIATNYTTHALHARFSVVVINRRRHCYECTTLHYRDIAQRGLDVYSDVCKSTGCQARVRRLSSLWLPTTLALSLGATLSLTH